MMIWCYWTTFWTPGIGFDCGDSDRMLAGLGLMQEVSSGGLDWVTKSLFCVLVFDSMVPSSEREAGCSVSRPAGRFFFLFSAEICFFFQVWRYTSFLQFSGPEGALYRSSGRFSPLLTIWSDLDCTSHRNTNTHTPLHWHRFSKYPNGPHFFNIYCLQFDKKIV